MTDAETTARRMCADVLLPSGWFGRAIPWRSDVWSGGIIAGMLLLAALSWSSLAQHPPVPAPSIMWTWIAAPAAACYVLWMLARGLHPVLSIGALVVGTGAAVTLGMALVGGISAFGRFDLPAALAIAAAAVAALAIDALIAARRARGPSWPPSTEVVLGALGVVAVAAMIAYPIAAMILGALGVPYFSPAPGR